MLVHRSGESPEEITGQFDGIATVELNERRCTAMFPDSANLILPVSLTLVWKGSALSGNFVLRSAVSGVFNACATHRQALVRS